MKSWKDNKNKFNNYIKFSSLALQMGVLITICALTGRWLDEKQVNTFPIWTLTFILLAIFGSLYKIIREVIRMGKDEEDN